MVNRSGIILAAWLQSIIVPIYKKGDSSHPPNCRPISFLSVCGKLYANYLLSRFTDWINSNGILGPEQAGFQAGSSAVDDCMILSHIIASQSALPQSRIFTAFSDLKSAFGTIDRDLLWCKLRKLEIDPRLLFLIQQLYSNNSCAVRLLSAGNTTQNIVVNKGVKQGCVLAPTLFNLFIHDLAPQLLKLDVHSPRIGTHTVLILLHADDMVLILRRQLGLKCLVLSCSQYLTENNLLLNYEKSKIMVYEKTWKSHQWLFNGNHMQQVKTF